MILPHPSARFSPTYLLHVGTENTHVCEKVLHFQGFMLFISHERFSFERLSTSFYVCSGWCLMKLETFSCFPKIISAQPNVINLWRIIFQRKATLFQKYLNFLSLLLCLLLFSYIPPKKFYMLRKHFAQISLLFLSHWIRKCVPSLSQHSNLSSSVRCDICSMCVEGEKACLICLNPFGN